MKIKKHIIKEYTDKNQKKLIIIFLILLLFLISLFLSSNRYKNKAPLPIEPTENATSENRDISKLTAVSLLPGEYKVGKDIKPGRYIAAPPKHAFGTLTIYELDSNIPKISQTLGFFSETANTPSVAITLVNGQIIEIEKLKSVEFRPLKTELKTELTTGFWEVGLDIKAGTYKVSSKEGLYGTIMTMSGKDMIASEKIGKRNEMEENESVILTLKNGETIRILHVPTVSFEEIDI